MRSYFDLMIGSVWAFIANSLFGSQPKGLKEAS